MTIDTTDSVRGPSKQFQSLKASLLRQGRLFEDPEFPAGHVALADDRVKFDWLRPREIAPNPVFILNGMAKSDLYQGNLKDCWVIAGAACMASAHTHLLERCIPPGQDFGQNYAGVFCFNFWRFGKWVEIIIDDRLPTYNGTLVFAANRTDSNEFWVPLFEKAYAKLYGGYFNLQGGFTTNALVDFTGGVSELIDLKDKAREGVEFYMDLYNMMKKSSMFGSHIQGDSLAERPRSDGLYTGHAYSIINFVIFTSKGRDIHLLQLRNPWGKGEWNGNWSDHSPRWKEVPEDFRAKMEGLIRDDGDFWMAFDDFIEHFQFLTICHLDPNSAEILGSQTKKKWKTQEFYDKWIRGFNAGGYERLWINPQFSISVDASASQSTMIISLMQEASNNQKCEQINFKIYKMKDENTEELLTEENHRRLASYVEHKNNVFLNMREMADHITVTPGKYVIIPCTFKTNVNRSFLLRVYTEMDIKSGTIDHSTNLIKIFSPQEQDFDDAFYSASKGTDDVDAKQLVVASNQILTKDGLFWTIGLETSRNLLALIDKRKTGVINLVGFRSIIKEILKWKENFKMFDRDLSGDIDTFELNQLFNSIGFNISRKVQETIFRRYGGKSCRLSFEDFVNASSKLINQYEVFIKNQSDTTPPLIQMPLEEWLSTGIY